MPYDVLYISRILHWRHFCQKFPRKWNFRSTRYIFFSRDNPNITNMWNSKPRTNTDIELGPIYWLFLRLSYRFKFFLVIHVIRRLKWFFRWKITRGFFFLHNRKDIIVISNCAKFHPKIRWNKGSNIRVKFVFYTAFIKNGRAWKNESRRGCDVIASITTEGYRCCC